MRNAQIVSVAVAATMIWSAALASDRAVVDDSVIAEQRKALAAATQGKGYGPQSPRDIDVVQGENRRVFQNAPDIAAMNLCNIHFHEGAEHKGGQFATYAGNGNGKGYGSGFVYSGELGAAETAPVDYPVGSGKHSTLEPGDTIELHYVHTTAQIVPGPTLGACLSESIKNPQLRVVAQVFVLVNDDAAMDFLEATKVEQRGGLYQATGMPQDMGSPIKYTGSTTGPGYNQSGSPFQVSWTVRPKVAKVSIRSVAKWLEGNMFDEDHAHGVRNLVQNPKLLSPIAN